MSVYHMVRQVPIFLVLLLLVIDTNVPMAAGGGFQDQDQPQQQPSVVGPYHEPFSSVFVSVLQEFFNEIKWQKIAEAREEVEKFVRAADRLLRAYRQSAGSKNSKEAAQSGGLNRIFSSSWWSTGNNKDKLPSLSEADSTQIKAMLERVACFVGYMKLLTHSHEALAELDASKVVSNLYGANKVNSSGYFSNWFG